MINQPMSAPDIRLLLPETLWLESDHFAQAQGIAERQHGEQQQWQAYLNALAMLTFADWLTERLPNYPIEQLAHEGVDASYLQAHEFKLCLITVEHVLDEVMGVSRAAIEQADLAAHFYVMLEVLEDQEQVIVRGFLPHDELITQANRIVSSQPDEFCLIPLSALDRELNHLVIHLQYAEPSAIFIPQAPAQSVLALPQQNLNEMRTRLSQWLQGVLAEGWQTIDTLINPDVNLAWSTRHTPLDAKGGKLINFGVQLGGQTVALLVTVAPESAGKIGVNIQVLPGGGAPVLPPQLRLTLLSDTNKLLQEVESRAQDNYIQLKPFKGKPGICFSIEVSLQDIRVKEEFEL